MATNNPFVTLDFYTLAAFDPFLKSTSRQLLALSGSEEETDADARLQNDVSRTMTFLMTFSIFATLWCTFSCYIYSRPHDSAQGTSLVSFIRRIPLLRWFYQQPHTIQMQQQGMNEAVADDTEAQPLKPTVIPSTVGAENDNADIETKTEEAPPPPVAVKSTPPSRTLLFGNENSTLLVCCIGLLIAYLTWGFMQERIMGHPYGDENDESSWFKYSSFCVMLNRFFGLLVSTVVLRWKKPSGNKAPPYVVSLCALSNMSSSWFQYEALHYVTFPVQTIFKSSKILITMAVGKVVLKKTFPIKKYLNAIVVAVGVYIFLSAQKQEKDKDASDDQNDLGMYFYLGLALISGYAFCDAFTSNWQQRIFKQTGIGPLEMMQSVNAFTFVVSFCFTARDLFDIYEFYMAHSMIVLHSLIMGLCAGFGQVLIFYTIQTFGAMKFATVMTTRMMCSVIISILYYGHDLTSTGMFGMFITFAALYYQAFSKGAARPAGRSK